MFSRGKRFAWLLPPLTSIGSNGELFRTRLIKGQEPAAESRPMNGLDRRLRRGVIVHFNEREAAGNLRITVNDQGNAGYSPIGAKQFTKLVFGRGDVQIADVNVLHGALLPGRSFLAIKGCAEHAAEHPRAPAKKASRCFTGAPGVPVRLRFSGRPQPGHGPGSGFLPPHCTSGTRSLGCWCIARDTSGKVVESESSA